MNISITLATVAITSLIMPFFGTAILSILVKRFIADRFIKILEGKIS